MFGWSLFWDCQWSLRFCEPATFGFGFGFGLSPLHYCIWINVLAVCNKHCCWRLININSPPRVGQAMGFVLEILKGIYRNTPIHLGTYAILLRALGGGHNDASRRRWACTLSRRILEASVLKQNNFPSALTCAAQRCEQLAGNLAQH